MYINIICILHRKYLWLNWLYVVAAGVLVSSEKRISLRIIVRYIIIYLSHLILVVVVIGRLFIAILLSYVQ